MLSAGCCRRRGLSPTLTTTFTLDPARAPAGRSPCCCREFCNISDFEVPEPRATSLLCRILADALDFLDRAADTFKPAGRSLSGLLDSARGAWMAVGGEGELQPPNWDDDSDVTNENRNKEAMEAIDDSGMGPEGLTPQRVALQLRRRRAHMTFNRVNDDSAGAASPTRVSNV